MRNDIEWELILKHLEKNVSPEELEKLNIWIQLDEKNQQILDQIQSIWNTPGFDLPTPDVEKAWQKCKNNVNIESTSVKQNSQFLTKNRKPIIFQRLWNYKLPRFAAAILIIIVIFYISSQFTGTPPLKEVYVNKGQKMIVTLSDETIVTLDAGSVFRYPERFTDKKREVYMSGEGYFEVFSNPEEPFVVHANNAVIAVTGTKFNVRTWPQFQSNKVTVVVVEGGVSLHPENNHDPSAKVFIAAGQLSELIKNNIPSTPQFVEIEKYTSWLEREMYFERVPLREVLDQLERWYDREILLPDSALAASLVTIYVEDKPITETLQIISLMNNLRFIQNGNKVIFTNGE